MFRGDESTCRLCHHFQQPRCPMASGNAIFWDESFLWTLRKHHLGKGQETSLQTQHPLFLLDQTDYFKPEFLFHFLEMAFFF